MPETKDPASVQVNWSVSGINHEEAKTLVSHLPIGSSTLVTVTSHPGESHQVRYELNVGEVSAQAAMDLSKALVTVLTYRDEDDDA